MKNLVNLFILLTTIVIYEAPNYELVVYEYSRKKEKLIEVFCAEGVTDCNDEPVEEKPKAPSYDQIVDAIDYLVYRPY